MVAAIMENRQSYAASCYRELVYKAERNMGDRGQNSRRATFRSLGRTRTATRRRWLSDAFCVIRRLLDTWIELSLQFGSAWPIG
jgi:hypothetical protein